MDASKSATRKAGRFADVIGKGLIAGLAGTIAITISQMIEMNITHRKASDTPAKAVEKTLEIGPAKGSTEKEFSQKVHWIYGITWGIGRGLLALTGLDGLGAAAIHFASVQTTSMIMLPSLKVAPPLREWGGKEIAIEGMHHAIYAIVAGVVFDLLDSEK